MLLAAAASIVLILIHHIHLLMYVPTIAVIVVLRHYLVQGVTRQNARSSGSPRSLAVGLLFFAAQFWGSLAVPEAEFVQHLQGRMADPARTNLLSFSFIWYQPLGAGNPRHLGSGCRRTCWACRCSRC